MLWPNDDSECIQVLTCTLLYTIVYLHKVKVGKYYSTAVLINRFTSK